MARNDPTLRVMKLTPTGPLPNVVGEDDLVILFDAECVVCSGWVHFVLRWDKARRSYDILEVEL